jgi:hypothetical protein
VLILYIGRRVALPRPIPGIPHNQDAASNILGDVPEMMRYVIQTKRVFVSALWSFRLSPSCKAARFD